MGAVTQRKRDSANGVWRGEEKRAHDGGKKKRGEEREASEEASLRGAATRCWEGEGGGGEPCAPTHATEKTW